MRFEITGQWKDGYKHDGLLYCAQRIEEMLMKYTSHLYKVPVFNSYLLCSEYLYVYDLVEGKNINSAHLNNTLEEFLDTFVSDIVIRDHFTDSEIEQFISLIKGKSLPEQRQMMYYLLHVMAEYPKWAAESLKTAVSNPNEKKKIEKALRSYLPMIIAIGYQPTHIYRYCKKIFCDPDICDEQCLNRFIDHFSGEDNEYTVYFAVDKRIEKFNTILTSRLGVSFDHDLFSEKLHFDRNKYVCINLTTTALDPNGAANHAYHLFNFFMRFYKFLGNRDEEWCCKNALVKDSDGNYEFPPFIPDFFEFSKDFDEKTLGSNSETIITKLLENAAGNDFFEINKIITTHNNALECQDIGNAFLNLWSVLEIIGVSEHAGTKISEVLQSIIPVLKRTYISKVVEEMHDYLKANISVDDYNQLLASINVKGDENYKVACLLAVPDNSEIRKRAYELLANYPLIRSRMSQLYEDVFKKKSKYIKELKRYEQRLSWHIQRLYRVRNSIIHSGDKNENIKLLVEHLHSYVDEIILEILTRLTQDNSLESIANVLIDARFFLGLLENECEKDAVFSEKDIFKMLS